MKRVITLLSITLLIVVTGTTLLPLQAYAKCPTPRIASSQPAKNSVTLRWKADPDTQYRVERKVKTKKGKTKYKVVRKYKQGIGSVTIKKLKTNTPYTFRIKARKRVDGAFEYSKYSPKHIVRTGPKINIYLTFDDGPSTTSTRKILKTLSKHKVKATFFMVGREVNNNKKVAREVARQGHTIANHGYSHNYQKIYHSSKAFMSDIKKGERIIKKATKQESSKLVRFPGGSTMGILQRNPSRFKTIKASLKESGRVYFDWDVDLADSLTKAPAKGSLSKSAIGQIKGKVARGDRNIVVLAHDTNSRWWTPLEIPPIIKYCKEQGFYFKTLSTTSPACRFR